MGSIKDLKGKYIDDTGEYISDGGVKNSNVKLIPSGTVIMSFKLTIGRLSITKSPLYTNEAIVGFIAKDNTSIDRDFLYYGLQSWDLLAEVDQAVKGATLNKDKMSRILGLFPPLPEQKKIASILTSVDEVIENTRAQINKLKSLKKAIMQDLLTKGIGHTKFKNSELGRIPESWNIRRFSDIASNRTTRFIPEPRMTETLYLGLEHLASEARSIKKFGNSSEIISAKTKFLKEDTLFGKLRPYLHKVAFPDCVGICSTDILVITPSKTTNPVFLYYICSSDKFVANAVEGSAGNIMPRTSWKDLATFSALTPPLLEQKKIASILTSVDEVTENTGAQVNKLQSLKKALMQDLLTGKVRVAV